MNVKLTRAELLNVAEADVVTLLCKQDEYGPSWKRRGGIGAFMMLARKWDRLEEQVQRDGYDIFASCAHDMRSEGILDDIADLRRYLLLVEAQVIQNSSAELQASNFCTSCENPGLCLDAKKCRRKDKLPSSSKPSSYHASSGTA